MKVFSKVIQWIVAVTFALMSLGTGSVVSGIIVFIAALLMAPIKPIRNFLAKIKIKSFVAIILSIILLFIGVIISPVAETTSDSDTGSTVNIEDSTTINNANVVESTKETNSESTTEETNSTTETINKDETEKESTKKDETTTRKETTTKKAETTTKKTETTTKKTETTTKRETTTVDPDSQVIVYVTAKGIKYHYENPCGNGTYYQSTLAEAKARGLTACEKCVLH